MGLAAIHSVLPVTAMFSSQGGSHYITGCMKSRLFRSAEQMSESISKDRHYFRNPLLEWAVFIYYYKEHDFIWIKWFHFLFNFTYCQFYIFLCTDKKWNNCYSYMCFGLLSFSYTHETKAHIWIAIISLFVSA